VEDPAWLNGPAQDEALRQMEPAAEVHRDCSGDISVLFEAVRRWGGGIGGDLAVIGDLRSIASL